MAEIASGFVARGHEIYLLTFDDLEERSFHGINRGIRRICIGAGEDSDSSKSFRILRQTLIMRRIVQQVAPDAAIGFLHSAYIPLGLAVWGSGIPLIASEHVAPRHFRVRPLLGALLYLTSFLTTKTACCSEQVRQAFYPFLQRKMIVLPSPIADGNPSLMDKDQLAPVVDSWESLVAAELDNPELPTG